LSTITEAGTVAALAIAVMAVIPECWQQGIGSVLVRRGLDECPQWGHKIVVVLGYPYFYPRFGFSAKLAAYLDSPFSGRESFMAVGLAPGHWMESRRELRTRCCSAACSVGWRWPYSESPTGSF
jgi:putative acetyltransferase